MSEIRFLTSSDEHISDLAVGYRKDDYRSAILGKIAWQGLEAQRFNANAVLRGGDLFHVKRPGSNSMRTLATLARIHRSYHCPTYALAGNHDITNNDLETVPSQPLGVLLKSEVLRELTEENFVSGSMKVRVVGVPYTTDLEVGGLQELVRKKDETYTVAVVHALAAMAPPEKIQSFFNEKIFDYRDLVFDGCPDVYIFGHYHKDQGIVDHLGVKFVNLGAISRGALTLENLERKPKVSLIKFDSRGVSVEESIVPHDDPLKVFDLEKKKTVEKQRASLDDFIKKLRADSNVSDDASIESKKKELDKYPDDLKKLCLDILEEAESGGMDDD